MKYLDEDDVPMNKGSLSRIERGIQRVKFAEAHSFARLFGVPLAELTQHPDIAANTDIVAAINEWAAAGEGQRVAAVGFSEASAAVERAKQYVSELLVAGGVDRDRVLAELQRVVLQRGGKDAPYVEATARTWYAALFLGRDPDEPAVLDWIENGGEFPNG